MAERIIPAIAPGDFANGDLIRYLSASEDFSPIGIAAMLSTYLLTTNGDLVRRAPGVVSRLAVGSSNEVLRVVSGLPAWSEAKRVRHFDAGTVGSSYSTGSLGFTPGLVVVMHSASGGLGIGWADTTSSSAGGGQASIEFINGFGFFGWDSAVAGRYDGVGTRLWRVTAFSSSGITITRVSGSNSLTRTQMVIVEA